MNAVAPSKACVECGDPNVVARERCKQHWRKHVKALKAAGTFQPSLTAQPLEERLWGQVAAGPQACIIWTGAVSRRTGYGKIHANGQHTSPHRVAYQLKVAPIAEGLHIDHTCHNHDLSCPGGLSCLHRRCINPHHLEAVTPGVNAVRSPNTPTGINARRSHCPSGHAYDEENTVRRPDGGRSCRTCQREDGRRRALAPAMTPTRATCKRGHPLTEDNLYRRGSINTCRACANEARQRYEERRAAR